MCRTVVPLRRPPSTRQPYSRDHILCFNLSIVPGITEFRRKSNAYCGTHKAVGHKTPTSGRVNGAQARTTCIFICSRTDQGADFFSDLMGLRAGPYRDGGHRAVICDLRYRERERDCSNHSGTGIGIPANPGASRANHESRRNLLTFIYNSCDDSPLHRSRHIAVYLSEHQRGRKSREDDPSIDKRAIEMLVEKIRAIEVDIYLNEMVVYCTVNKEQQVFDAR